MLKSTLILAFRTFFPEGSSDSLTTFFLAAFCGAAGFFDAETLLGPRPGGPPEARRDGPLGARLVGPRSLLGPPPLGGVLFGPEEVCFD